MKLFIKKISLILLICLILPFLSGCDIFWGRYYNNEYNFSILLPRVWQRETGFEEIGILAREKRKTAEDKFQENVNVSVIEFPDEVDLDTFFEVNKTQITLSFVSAKEIEENDVNLGFLHGKELSFTGRMEGLWLKVRSAVVRKGKFFYIISCAAQAEEADVYEPVFKKIMRSIRIK